MSSMLGRMILAGCPYTVYHVKMLEAVPLIPLFEGLSDEQNATLMNAFEHYSSNLGAVVFEQGDPANYLYLIVKGDVSIMYKPYDGEKITLTRLKDGGVFGWSAVVGTNKYSSGAVCNSDLEAIRLRRDHLLKLMETTPDASKVIIDRLALNVSPRWKDAYKQIEPLITPKRKTA